jgi:uncharacterized membrane protein HdeD (DUF308 family)/alpha-beta hydrolase superfamily lysophospholipase
MSDCGSRRPTPRRFYRTLFDRFPWWAALALGLAAVGLGAAITLKPFASLGVLVALVAASLVVTGFAELVSGTSSLERWSGAGWLACGIAVAVWPGLTIRGLAAFVGVVLLLGGLVRVAAAVREDADERPVAALSGLARAVFGVLALSWPDVTLLVVALLVGPAVFLFGLGRAASALRRRGRPRNARPAAGGRRPRARRLAGAALSLVAALGLLAGSALVHRSSPSPDAFYDTPDDVPAEPGRLLRSGAFTRGVPEGARAWRILYTTTRDDETPALASGLVVAPRDAPAGPRPVIAWAHGTTGFDSKCAPSLLPDPFRAGATPALDEVAANGWVLVATDYVGLGTAGPHPYLIGGQEARSVLDSVRAARQLEELELEDRTVVWGHSQGGGAALWTGALAPGYAPDVGVIGVAALSPAAALTPLLAAAKDRLVGRILGSYVLSAYDAAYPDVSFDEYVRPPARILARETARRCLSGPEAIVSVATAVGRDSWFSRDPTEGPLGARLEENTPDLPIAAPLLVGQGLDDPLVLPAEQQRFVAGLCAAGRQVEYRTYAGFGHVDIVLDRASPLVADLLAWTQDRLAGRAQAPGCQTVEG